MTSQDHRNGSVVIDLGKSLVTYHSIHNIYCLSCNITSGYQFTQMALQMNKTVSYAKKRFFE